MKKTQGAYEVLVSWEPFLTQIAFLKEGRVEHFFVERPHQKSEVGNIYKGRVVKVLKGLQAAFVDIGTSRNGFLPFEEQEEWFPLEGAEEEQCSRARKPLAVGEECVVQVTKPGFEHKGVKLTAQVSLPGRLLVLLPFSSRRGVSRRIESAAERQRLAEILGEVVPSSMGFIVRTACSGKKKDEIQREARFLISSAEKIKRLARRLPPGSLLREEDDLPAVVLRDYVTEDVREILVDSERVFRQMRVYARAFMPEVLGRIRLVRDRTPLLERYGVTKQIVGFLDERVPLPSGGYLLIEEGNHLMAIDVNTGGSQRKSLSDTIFHTNLEAAQEIPRQIRVRNLSGLIVIDFIDMKDAGQRRQVFETLEKAMESDKARTKTLHISKLGLVEMSREKFGLSLVRELMSPCACCGGTGRTKSVELAAIEAKNALVAKMQKSPSARMTVRLSKDLREFCEAQNVFRLSFLERRRVAFQTVASFQPCEFEIV